MKTINFGKFRGMQRCASDHGAMAVLALDHRNNLRRALNPADPDSVTDQVMVNFKKDVTEALAPNSSAVLLDPEVGAFQAIASGKLPGSVGLIVALEATGYAGDSAARESRILDSWSVQKIKRMGADAVKLLVYYHPDSPQAHSIEELVHQVAEECEKEDIFFMLEPLTYSHKSGQGKLSGDEKIYAVTETARRLAQFGADILKVEFPVDIQMVPDEADWVSGCSDLSAGIDIPWVLLSASVDYETYLRQVAAACQGGASGVAVGRAVWKEAADSHAHERRQFLSGEASQRMQAITALVDQQAKPLSDFFSAATADSSAYKNY